jgi:hypothetical protein
MPWPKGKPHTAASEGMRRWHREHPRAQKPRKPSRSLAFLSPEERRAYNTLRRYGVSREAAIAAILPKVAA